MSTPTIGSYVKTTQGEYGYFAGVTGSLYAIVKADTSQIGVMPETVTVTHTPGYMAEGDRGILYFDGIDAARAYGVPVPTMIPVLAEVEDRFPVCKVCSVPVEDAGDHADNAGHWPWTERVYLNPQS